MAVSGMITAEEARSRCHVDICSHDMRIVKQAILNALSHHNAAGCVVIADKIINLKETIKQLQSPPMNYIVRRHPNPEEEHLCFVVQWEQVAEDVANNRRGYFSWPEWEV